jgi:hypothetical protein
MPERPKKNGEVVKVVKDENSARLSPLAFRNMPIL